MKSQTFTGAGLCCSLFHSPAKQPHSCLWGVKCCALEKFATSPSCAEMPTLTWKISWWKPKKNSSNTRTTYTLKKQLVWTTALVKTFVNAHNPKFRFYSAPVLILVRVKWKTHSSSGMKRIMPKTARIVPTNTFKEWTSPPMVTLQISKVGETTTSLLFLRLHFQSSAMLSTTTKASALWKWDQESVILDLANSSNVGQSFSLTTQIGWMPWKMRCVIQRFNTRVCQNIALFDSSVMKTWMNAVLLQLKLVGTSKCLTRNQVQCGQWMTFRLPQFATHSLGFAESVAWERKFPRRTFRSCLNHPSGLQRMYFFRRCLPECLVMMQMLTSKFTSATRLTWVRFGGTLKWWRTPMMRNLWRFFPNTRRISQRPRFMLGMTPSPSFFELTMMPLTKA